MRSLVVVGAAVLAGWWALLFFMQRSMLFLPPDPAGAPARPADARQVWLATDAGPVEAWLLEPITPSSAPAPVLLFTHGNGELIDYWPARFEEPRRWGMAVLLLEYPGYGRSAGNPSEASITGAILAAYEWARAEPSLDPARIIPYGRSLGGGAAAILGARRPVPALILESSFTSVRSFSADYWAPAFLVRDPFDSLSAVREFPGPILVLHGERDQIIPTEHGLALAAASPDASLVLLPCAHNDCPRPWPAIRDFLVSRGLLAGVTQGIGR